MESGSVRGDAGWDCVVCQLALQKLRSLLSVCERALTRVGRLLLAVRLHNSLLCLLSVGCLVHVPHCSLSLPPHQTTPSLRSSLLKSQAPSLHVGHHRSSPSHCKSPCQPLLVGTCPRGGKFASLMSIIMLVEAGIVRV